MMLDENTINEGKDQDLELRKVAEEKIQEKELEMPVNIENMDKESIKKIIHELKVHQVELEMQNEELRRVQAELDLSRRKYFDLYDHAPVGYLTLNEEGVIIELNLTAAKLLGTDRRDIIRKPFTRFIMRDDQDIFYHHRRLIQRTRQHQECELRMLYAGAGAFWTLLSTLPDIDNRGSLNYRVVISDISQRKETEKELRKAKKKAVAANEAKSQFLANMSHEIRTPLNGLMGMTHLLTTTALNENQQEYVIHIKSSADLLLRVIDDILDYSKMEAGEMDLESIPFQPKEVLEEVSDVFSFSASRKGLEIKVMADENIPRMIGDPYRFRQVLTNLISNAVKYTHKGEIRITLKNFNFAATSKIGVKCSVQDTGIGIQQDKIQSMFERFSQADSSNTRQYGGTGLGLAICKGLVEKMGGEIWAESTPGKGSRFTFTIFSEESMKSEEESNGKRKDAKLMKKEVDLLLVEDNEISRKLIQEIGKINGWNITLATDGIEAVEMFKMKTFDGILMDVQLPGFDGYKATEMIRKWEKSNGTHTPIIGLTAHATEGTREKCVKAGMDEYLTKPINPKKLELLVAIMTDGSYHSES